MLTVYLVDVKFIRLTEVMDLYCLSTYSRVYLRSPTSPNPTFASCSTASLGEVLFIWFMFGLIWSDLKYGTGNKSHSSGSSEWF